MLYAPLHKNIDPRSFDSTATRPDPVHRPATARAVERLSPPKDEITTSTRGCTVEPVFGQTNRI